MPNHYTAAEWDDFVRQNFKSALEAELWRNDNNVFVDGMAEPEYNGPLSTGGYKGELPPSNPSQTPVYPQQGTPKVDEQEVTGALDAAPATEAADVAGGLDALALANLSPQDYYRRLADIQKRASNVQYGMTEKDYSDAEAKIKARRYGPSQSEQLFKLAAALAKPTLTRSFGEIMGNVAPTLAGAEEANRQAEMQREMALEALKRQYLLEGKQGEMAKLGLEQKVLASAAPLLAAGMRPRSPISNVIVDNTGVAHGKKYGIAVYQPPTGRTPAEIAERTKFMGDVRRLQAFLADPNVSPEEKSKMARGFDDTYGLGASGVYGE